MRCFVAVPLPDTYQTGLAEIVRQLRPRLASKLSWTKPGNWHITLKFLGDVEAERRGELQGALSDVPFEPFTLQAGGGGFFPSAKRPRVLWAGLDHGAEECGQLAGRVDDALVGIGFAREEREFRPHLTMGRIRQDRRDDWLAVQKMVAAWRWTEITVKEFLLYQSVLGPQGPKYSKLTSYPLD